MKALSDAQKTALALADYESLLCDSMDFGLDVLFDALQHIGLNSDTWDWIDANIAMQSLDTVLRVYAKRHGPVRRIV